MLSGPLVSVGVGMMLVGLGFKLSLVPFHLWTPDVYEGAPAPVSAFLATASKGRGVRRAAAAVPDRPAALDNQLLNISLSVIAVASILFGNLLALTQSNIKRLLGYSSIAHLGYLLVALIASKGMAVEAVGVYLATYVLTSLGAFGVITLMSTPYSGRDADALFEYRGLFWRRPVLTAVMTVMMLSLAGIPLTAGFIGKFYVIAVGVESHLWWLIGALVLEQRHRPVLLPAGHGHPVPGRARHPPARRTVQLGPARRRHHAGGHRPAGVLPRRLPAAAAGNPPAFRPGPRRLSRPLHENPASAGFFLARPTHPAPLPWHAPRSMDEPGGLMPTFHEIDVLRHNSASWDAQAAQ